MRRLAALFLLFVAACGGRPPASQQTPLPTPEPSPTKKPASRAVDAEEACKLLPYIKTLPFDNEPGIDAAFDALMEAGDKALLCLIEQVDDTTPMEDPRPGPHYRPFRVGDAAYIMIVTIARIDDFMFPFPENAKKEFEDIGVYAYFDYINQPGSRRKLRRFLLEWHRTKHGARIHVRSATLTVVGGGGGLLWHPCHSNRRVKGS